MSMQHPAVHPLPQGSSPRQGEPPTPRDEIALLARTYAKTPPLPFYQQAVRLREHLHRALELRRDHPDVAPRDLHIATGQVCTLMACAALDLGYTPAATEQARTAFVYGEVAQHDGVRAYARGLQAIIACWDRRPREALELARSTEVYARSGTAAIRLACVRARAWALLGDSLATREALDAAQRERKRLYAPDDMYDVIGGEFGCSRARQHHWHGTALLSIGDVFGSVKENRKTLRAFTEAGEDDQERLEPLLEAYARADLATAYLQAHDLDSARTALEPVWEVEPTHRRIGLTRRMDATRTALTAPLWRQNDSASELRDRIETYNTEATLARALPVSSVG